MSSYVFIKVLNGDFEGMFNSWVKAGISAILGADVDFILTGSMLPFSGVTWKSRCEVVREDYIGSPVAGLQVLGSREEDLQWDGSFKESKLGVGIPEKMWTLFDNLRRGGNLLKIQFKKNVREGILSEFTKKYSKGQSEIGYTMNFVIRSRGEVMKTNFDKLTDPLGNIASAIADITNQLEILANMPANIAKDIMSSINTIIGNATRVLSKTREMLDNYVSVGTELIKTAENIIIACKQIYSLIMKVDTLLDPLSDQVLSFKNTVGISQTSNQTVGYSSKEHVQEDYQTQNENKQYLTRSRISCSRGKLAAYTIQLNAMVMLGKKEDNIDKVTRLRENENLWAVAKLNYGSVAYAGKLAKYNDLKTMFPAIGTLIKLPYELV